MSFLEILSASVKGSFPGLLYWLVFPVVPFIIAEQLRPVATAPKLRDYWANLLISVSTAYLSLPLGISAALLSSKLHHLLPWKPLSWSFHNIAAVPVVGRGLEAPCDDFCSSLHSRLLVLLVASDRTPTARPLAISQASPQRRADEHNHLGPRPLLAGRLASFLFRLYSRPLRRPKTSRSGKSSALFHDVSRGTLHVLSLCHSHSSALA